MVLANEANPRATPEVCLRYARTANPDYSVNLKLGAMGKRSLPVWVFRVFRLTGKLRLLMAPVSKAFRDRY